MTGSDFNFGPDWLWVFFGILIVIGLLTIAASIIALIVWLIHHIHFV